MYIIDEYKIKFSNDREMSRVNCVDAGQLYFQTYKQIYVNGISLKVEKNAL